MKRNQKDELQFTSYLTCAGHDEMSAASAVGHVPLVSQEAVWMLLSYKPTEVQEPPEACYSQLMHSPNLPLLFSSPCSSSLSLSPLSFLSSPFSMSYCSLSYTLPLFQVLTTLFHHASFPLPALSHVHMHSHIYTDCGSYHNSMQPPPHSSKAVYKCLWLALTHILI